MFNRSRQPGTKSSLALAIDENLELLFRVARQLTGNDTDAEDIVGQTLLQATKAWPRFDGRHPRAWLLTILRNEFFASARWAKARPEVPIEDSQEPMDNTFWHEIDWRLIGDGLSKILTALPDEFRHVIALCDIEEVSRDEAALVLNVPVGTINSRLHRGRKLLRERVIRELGLSH
ncbi:MAG: RNA polymerase sigma factor [Chthonomonas sp.]|nr:RNA polymerase sigma factor [Chthonomonas sp.]